MLGRHAASQPGRRLFAENPKAALGLSLDPVLTSVWLSPPFLHPDTVMVVGSYWPASEIICYC